MSEALARRGFSVRVFLPDGDPAGVKVIEKSNWTGMGLVIPRALYAEAKKRPELDRAGVYVLVGESDSGPLPVVYVGEGDPVRPRLEEHGRKKDFWTHAVIFTSKDQSLNKAHVQHLESRLVDLAAQAKRCVLDNGNAPQAPSLTEADTAEVEGFLDDILLCLPTLGYAYFERARARHVGSTDALLQLKGRGVEARGAEAPDGFVVRAGSHAVKAETESCDPYLRESRAALVQQGVFRDDGDRYELTQDYTFASPSMAAGVILGRAANGRTEWKTPDGRTLKVVQEAAGGA
ncbi:MAG: GIY-YIG nuclease family protein [Gemmatimonadaceae bacterium]